MKLKGAEKHFWWLFKQITDSKDIPNELPGFTSIDSCTDDEEMAVLTARFTVMGSIYLKETLVTDEAVKSSMQKKSDSDKSGGIKVKNESLIKFIDEKTNYTLSFYTGSICSKCANQKLLQKW